MSIQPGTLPATWATRRASAADYYELTKPGVTSLIIFATLVGFYLGSVGGIQYLLLAHTLLGTALVAGGTAALNQYWEREADSRMWRTRNRPLPTGRLAPWKALLFGIGSSATGIIYLCWQVNLLAGMLTALTLASYLFLYTPLKTR